MIVILLLSGSLLLALFLGRTAAFHPLVAALVPPVLVAAGLFVLISLWPTGSSTDAVAIPFGALFAAAGSLPGAFIGAWLRRRRREPKEARP